MIDYDGTCDWPDFHSVVTIQLCELIDAGFCDETMTGWEWPKYSDEQDSRLRKKIVDHYLYREISLVPPGLWKHEFIRKMNEIMPKYVPLYKLLNEQPELFGGSSDYYKSRNVYSDFPQTQLSGSNGDYASSGNDMESQRIRQADVLDIAKRLDSYNDVDLMIIEDMQTMFSSLMTVSINAF
nr:MAG TPA: Lower collar protein [Bacteriophage sp.]